jgi:hypothetical protein
MARRFRTLGILMAVIGLGFLVGGGVAYTKVQQGYGSLEALSAAQNVQLSYNEDGQLIDRGETAGADAIMSLLKDDWKYPVVDADLDPNDPVVDTASEYMYQMATITYHTLHSTVTVVLDEDEEYNGETFTAGSYEFEVDGRYWADFDRQHPIEGPARAQAWNATPHALIAELGVGTATHSALQLGLGVAGAFAGIGLTLVLLGFGLMWAGKSEGMTVMRDSDSSLREPVRV